MASFKVEFLQLQFLACYAFASKVEKRPLPDAFLMCKGLYTMTKSCIDEHNLNSCFPKYSLQIDCIKIHSMGLCPYNLVTDITWPQYPVLLIIDYLLPAKILFCCLGH